MTAPSPPATGGRSTRQLQGQRAGLISRLAASAVDLVVIIVALGGIYLGIAAIGFLVRPRSFHWPEALGWSVPFVALVIGTPYLSLAWCAIGRTVGDVLFGLRVLSESGRRLDPARSTLRALFCLIFPLGLFWIVFSANRKSVQDVVLRSKVIYDWASHRELL
ncbi:MAG TPA: RDD family protein [Jatrophihabitantaceae bacterium]|nr:RDD family protein [Jatrophihabitantaceae bacterium]